MENRKIDIDKIKYFYFCQDASVLLKNSDNGRREINLENMKWFINSFKPNEIELSSWDSISWWIAKRILLRGCQFNIVKQDLIWNDRYNAVKNIPEPVRAEYLLEMMEFEYDERFEK